jgi:hypothetical protein
VLNGAKRRIGNGTFAIVGRAVTGLSAFVG